ERGRQHRPDGEGQDHQDQPRDAPHLAGHQAAPRRSVGGHRRPLSGRGQAEGPRHEHHRLRRVRGAGAGHRRPDPRVRDVLDQEERPPGQDRLHLPGGRGGHPGGRSGQAAHLARPQAGPAQPVGGLRRDPPRRLGGRGRGQEQDRVRPVHRPRRRRRRHGPPLRPRLEPAGRAGDRRLQEGRRGARPGARHRCREGAHLARHQAARRRPLRRCRRNQERPGRHLRGSRGEGFGPRGEDRRYRPYELHPPGRARPRPRRPAAGALCARREDGRPCDPVRPQGAPRHAVGQGARDGRGEGGDRPVRLDRLRGVARRYPWGRAEEGRHRQEV
ncbi:MAG: SSU ribosomal protein S1p, partial [uncultured Microvirga sp.]